MESITSRGMTVFSKVVFPPVFTIASVVGLVWGRDPLWWRLIAAPFFLCAIVWMWRDLARLKFVSFDGKTLEIRGYRKAVRVPLSSLIDVQQESLGQGIATLLFDHETLFGRRVRFIPWHDSWFILSGPDSVIRELRRASGILPGTG